MLSKLAFLCLVIVAMVSPWFFGSWEQWWFWPFTAVIFLGSLLAALFLIRSYRHDKHLTRLPDTRTLDLYAQESRLASYILWGYGLFLVYALIMALKARVYMDAERSLLLHLTPVLLAGCLLVSCNITRLKTLYRMIMVNLLLLGIYGIINHALTGSRLVLWIPGYEQYTVDSRMTGTYYCPDHFAGVMEIAFAMALGMFMTRVTAYRDRILSEIIITVSVFCIIMSKSRGGGLTLIVIIISAITIGLGQWRTSKRWIIRATSTGTLVLILILLWSSNTAYIKRFKEEFGFNSTAGKSMSQIIDTAKDKLIHSCRGRMYAGAIRAWKASDMLVGIGPGMHQHLWPHFSASDDGDRVNGIWPSVTYSEIHSYEVHSDWLQLLEEYGTLGILLFGIPMIMITAVHLKALRHESRRRKRLNWQAPGIEMHGYILGGLLSGIAMAFHSLGDFNLQMPATTWILGTVIALTTTLSIVSIYGNRPEEKIK